MRFYLANAANPYNPVTRQGSWEENTGSGTSYLTTTKTGTNTRTSFTRTSTSQPRDILNRTFVSDAFVSPGTITGSMSAVIAVDEGNGSANYFSRVYVWVTQGDSASVRGTLIDSTSATESVVAASGFPSTAVALSGTVTSVTAQIGDRVVVEVGYTTTSALLNNGGLRYGGTDATDLAVGNTTTAADTGLSAQRSPWIDLPVDALFVPPVVKTQTLTDNFDDNSINTTKWPNNTGSGVSEASGKATIATNAGTYAGYGSVANYEITGSIVSAKVTVGAPQGGATNCHGRIQYTVDANNHMELLANSATGLLTATLTSAGSLTVNATSTYSSVNHAWLRLREASGTLYWEGSPDNVAWTSFQTATKPTAFTTTATGRINLDALANGSSASTITFDSFNIFPTPGEVLHIGPDRPNKFSVQIAVDGSTGNSFDTYTETDIQNGLDLPPYFTTIRDGAKYRVQFDVRADSATTSGSSFPRQELRERDLAGANIAFDPWDGEHWIKATYKITNLPALVPEAVFMQLHNGNADRIAVRTQVISGTNMLCHRINGSATGLPRMMDPFAFNTEFTVKIRIVNGNWYLYYNDMTTPFDSSLVGGRPQLSPTADPQIWYFKAGLYLQTNESEVPATDRAQNWLSDLTHWHTGWPLVEVSTNRPGQFFALL